MNTVDPELLTQVRNLYMKWTGYEIAQAHAILRKEFDAYSLTPGKILTPTNQVVDPPAKDSGNAKPKVSRVAKKAVSDQV